MPNGFGQGRGSGRGFGRGMGFGFRGASPPWPYIGRGRGGLPRCGYFPGGAGAPPPWPYQPPFYGQEATAPGYAPFSPQMDKEQELDYLKGLAQSMRDDLKEIETRVQEIESKKE